jgi:dTMP kinase
MAYLKGMSENKHHIDGGLVIMFEGIDGTGKTTQLALVEHMLKQDNWLVSTSRSPGGTPIGEALRTVMLQKQPRPAMTDLYIAAAIQEALIEAMNAERAAGKVILHDRGPLSIAAYQIYGGGVDESIGWHYVERGMNQLKPDLVIVYSCDPKEALRRAHQQSGTADYFTNQPLSYFERVAKGYQEVEKRYKVVVIDATASIDAVHERTMHYVNQLLGAKA